MKRWLLLLPILLLGLFPTQAQDGCKIDLLDEIAQLAEAQRAADTGDTTAAAQTIAEVQAQLVTQLEACAPGNGLLSEIFEFPDGLFRFSYPADWAVLSPVAGVYALGNSQTAVNSLVETNFEEALPAGTQILVAAYGNRESVFNVDSFAEFQEQIQEDGMGDTLHLTGSKDVVINDYQAIEFTVASDLFAGRAYALDLRASKIAFFLAITPPGEFEAFAPTFEAIVASMRVGVKAASTSATTTSTATLVPNPGKPLSEITYTEALNIRDLIEDVDWGSAALAPDGTRIAWFKGDGICLYKFTDQNTECQPIPSNFNSRPPVLLWSPDSRYVAFTQDGLRYFHEPDIWVFNTNSQTFVNRTDDNINHWRFSGEVGPDDSPGPLWFDHTVTWGPDGNLYFVRFEAPKAADFAEGRTGLYRISPTEGDAELIRDLTNDFERFSIYQVQQYDLHGALVVSPDASQIAFIVLAPQLDSPQNGVWVMPLSGAEAPRQIVRATDFTLGTPAKFQESGGFLFPMDLAWTPDQTGLYIFAGNPAYAVEVAFVLYHVSLDAGVLTPLTDFSQYTSADLFKVDAALGHAPIYEVPRAVVMSPDGTTPLVFHFDPDRDTAGLSALSLGDNGLERTPVFEFDYGPLPGRIASVAADGKLLIFGTLFLPEE